MVWSLERARTDDPRFYSRSLLLGVDAITAPDDATVRISTKAPDVATLQKLSVDNLAVLAREVVEKYPKPSTSEAAVGTGPFVLITVEERAGAAYLRNPDYWDAGRPYLDGVRTRHFSDALSAWAAFLAGQVDVAAVPGSEAKKYLAEKGVSPYWFPDDTVVSFVCPNLKRKPMDDARVTRALRLLIDHDEFISAWAETHQGRGAHGSVFPTALSAWDLPQDEYKQHLEWKQPKADAAKEALSLLAAAGFSKDNPLRLTLDGKVNDTVGDAGQLAQAQWQRLGQGAVEAQFKVSDTPTIDAIRASRSFTYGVFGFSAGMAEPGIWLNATYRSGGSLNFAGMEDPQLDALIDKQQTIFDGGQRRTAIREIILYMIDHAPTTVGANDFTLNAVQPRVRGFTAEGFLNGHQYRQIWLAQ